MAPPVTAMTSIDAVNVWPARECMRPPLRLVMATSPEKSAALPTTTWIAIIA
ncbi:hypothetical protein ACLEPN_02720 [Myxococcus sp. 1LA]